MNSHPPTLEQPPVEAPTEAPVEVNSTNPVNRLELPPVRLEMRADVAPKPSLRRRAKQALGVVAIGAAAYGGYWAYEHFPHIPNPVKAVGQAVGDAGHALGTAGHAVGDVAHGFGSAAHDVLAHGKDGADRTAAKVSKRKVTPVTVNPKSVLIKQAKSMPTFGRTERPIVIKDAVKKYDTWVPQGDEWLHFRNGEFVGEANVIGGIAIQKRGNTISVSLPRPTVTKDLITRREPIIRDDTQKVSKVGQFFGNKTHSDQARREYDNYINSIARADQLLAAGASCAARENVETIFGSILKTTGTDVFIGNLFHPVGKVDNNPNNDIILDVTALKSGVQGSYDASECQPILAATGYTDVTPKDANQLPKTVLPKLVTDQLKLKPVKG